MTTSNLPVAPTPTQTRTRGIIGGIVSLTLLVALSVGAFGFDQATFLRSDIAAATTQPMTITSFSPSTAAIGETLDLTFSQSLTTLDGYTFSFAGANARRVSATDIELITHADGVKVARVRIPTGTVTGRIGFTYGGNLTLAAVDFPLKTAGAAPTTTPAPANTNTPSTSPSSIPAITGFTPNRGAVGTAVYVALDKIPTNPNAYKIYFAGFNATRIEVPDREVVYVNNVQAIRTRVPTGAITGRIALSVGGVISESEWDFTVVDDANASHTAAVTISEVSPTETTVGSTIYIAGSGFAERADDNIVEFAAPNAATVRSRNLKVTSLRGTPVLQVVVPEGALTGRVSVAVAGSAALSPTDVMINNSNTLDATQAELKAAPEISELSATDLVPGDQLLIAGTNLNHPDASVKIGGVDSPIISRAKNGAQDILLTTVPPTARSGFVIVAVGNQLAIYPQKVTVVGATGGAPVIDPTRNFTLPATIDTMTSQASFYVFVSDPDGVADIDSVTLDLTAIGGRPMNAMQPGATAGTGRTYAFENFTITNILTSDLEYRLPIIATDKSGFTATGEFILCTGVCLTPEEQAAQQAEQLEAMIGSDYSTITPASVESSIEGAHAAAASDIIRPVTPMDVVVTSDRGYLRFMWTNPSTANDAPIVGYYIYYGLASGAELRRFAVGLVQPYFTNELERGVTYYFAVTAVDANGIESLPSMEVTATMPLTNNSTASFNSQPTPTYLDAAGNVVTDPTKIAAYHATRSTNGLHGSAPEVLFEASVQPLVDSVGAANHAAARKTQLAEVGPAESLAFACALAFLAATFVVVRRRVARA